MWNADGTGRPDLLAGHGGPITTASFSREGRYLVTASEDGTARIWDLKGKREPRRLGSRVSRIQALAVSVDGGRLAVASSNRARVWRVDGGGEAIVLEHPRLISRIAFSPEGERLATASDDGLARIWSTESGALILELDHGGARVSSAAFSPDGGRLVTASVDGLARIWGAESGALMLKLDHGGARVSGAAFDPRGQRVVTAADGSARIWSAESGELVRELDHGGARVYGAAFSPEGERVLTAADGFARVWSAESGRLMRKLDHGDRAVYGAAFSPTASAWSRRPMTTSPGSGASTRPGNRSIDWPPKGSSTRSLAVRAPAW